MTVSASKRAKYKLRHYPERVPPTVLLFALAILSVIIGLGITVLRFLAWIGAFVVGVYLVVWIVWLVNQLG